MTISWLRHHEVTPTKSPWMHRNKQVLPQQKIIDNFCKDKNVNSRWISSSVPNSSYDMVTLMFSDHKLTSIQHVDDCLIHCVSLADRFLHLSVNKFLLYSDVDRSEHLDRTDLDQRLIQHWINLLKLKVELVNFNSDDKGHLGNWVYPVTNIVWSVDAKI